MYNAIYKTLIFIVKFIPMDYNGYIHKFCTYLLSDVFAYRKKVITQNLNATLFSDQPAKLEAVVKEYYKNLTAYILESIQLFAKDLSWFKGRIQYNGLDEIRRCLSSSSVIVIGSHMGNWEWSAVLFPPMTQLPAYAVYKPLSNKSLDVPVKASRSRFGLGLLNMKEVIRFMHKKHDPAVFFFVSDQSPADVASGSWHTFLGKETLFYDGPALLSQKYGLPVFIQTISRIHGSTYTVNFERIQNPDITGSFVQNLEAAILKEPEAWLWSHKRWKHKKTGDIQ